MLAYQMIYTACGKDKSGAFSIWSKSQELSKQECDEITRLMNYRKPRNAPLEPTREEILEFFPPKFAYFNLSSGRKCIAKSSYVGNVYSDMDGRSGNFVIHAFVFDQLADVNPFFIFGYDGFKSELTYKEWHDDPVPESLPQKEIRIAPDSGKGNLQYWISPSMKNNFSMLMEAVIRGAENNEEVVFVDSEERQRELYNAIGLLLPNNILEKTTFSTRYSMQAEYSFNSIGGVPVIIRNMTDIGVPNGLNLQEAIDSDKLVFAFDKNKFCNITVRPYVDGLIADLAGRGIEYARKEVDCIGQIMNKSKCDIDCAYSILKFINKDYSFFKTMNDFLTVLTKAREGGYIDPGAASLEIYNTVIKTGRYGRGREILPLLSQVYGMAPGSLRDAIIKDFFNALGDYIAVDNGDIVASFNNAAPFSWDDFVGCVVRTGYSVNGMAEFGKIRLLYLATLDAIRKNLGSRPDNERLLIAAINRSVQKKDMEEISALIRDGKAKRNQFEMWVVDSVFRYHMEKTFPSAQELDFAFSLVNVLQEDGPKEKCVLWIVQSNIRSPYLMDSYIRCERQNPSVFGRVEKQLTGEDFRLFQTRKEMNQLRTESFVDAGKLDNYFSKYYKNKMDDGTYREVLGRYLKSLDGTMKVKECLRQLGLLKDLPESFRDVLEIYKLIEREVYTASYDDLLDYNPEDIRELSRLNGILVTRGCSSVNGFAMLNALANLSFMFGKEETERLVFNGEIYRGLSEGQLSECIRDHLGKILKCYFTFRNGSCDVDALLLNLFGEIFCFSDDNTDILIGGFKRLRDDYLHRILADFMYYACRNANQFSDALKSFIEKYLQSEKPGDAKRTVRSCKNLFNRAELAEVEPFIDGLSIQEEKAGFLDKLFRRFNKED